MSRKHVQPLVQGYSVGRRPVIDGKIACLDCGEMKEVNRENFAITGRQWCRWCRVCEADRVAMIHLRERIRKHGAVAEIASIQQAERDIIARKDRLHRVLQERGAGV